MILHLDADAFFASCEQSLDPTLRGQPVVVGAERGITSAMSYSAKALGVTRGMSISQVRALSPVIVIKHGNYTAYKIFSKRIMNIVRRFVDEVEVYSIDECFGILPVQSTDKIQILLLLIQTTIQHELGLSVSVGSGTTKTLAKLASSHNKPYNCLVLDSSTTERLLLASPVEKVWGIGKQTTKTLHYYGIMTACAFTQQPYSWVQKRFPLPVQHTWHELCGTRIFNVDPFVQPKHKSISKTRTFTPFANSQHLLFAHLTKNIEAACKKARQCGRLTKSYSFFLKQQDMKYRTCTGILPYPTNDPSTLLQYIEPQFDQIWDPNTVFRTTGITLGELLPHPYQGDLLGLSHASQNHGHIQQIADSLNKRYGKDTIFLAPSLSVRTHYKNRQTNQSKPFSIPFGGMIT
ncbi:MAG: DNA polymerase-4 [Planctomycetota bacterium]|jgi:DNA polymerase-4